MLPGLKIITPVLILCIMGPFQSFGQTGFNGNGKTFENFLEDNIDWQEFDIDPEYYFDILQTYNNNPIRLNETNARELEQLPLLNAIQINEILKYQKEYAPIRSIYELLYLPYFDKQTLQLLQPFIAVNKNARSKTKKGAWDQIKKNGDHTFLLRWQDQLERPKGFEGKKGAQGTSYTGSPGKLLSRVKSRHRNYYSMALTMEKDSGEPFYWQPKEGYYGTDFIAGHILVKNVGNFEKIVAGDYQLNFGQGLIFGSGFMTGKGPSVIQGTRQLSTGIDGYTSTRESGFLRGLATTYQLGNWYFTGFYSHNRQDGKIEQNHNNNRFFTSLQSTGYHRTPHELAGREQISEQTLGGNLIYRTASNNFNAGVTFSYNAFNIPLLPDDAPYKTFAFRGRENNNAGMYANYIWNDFHFFGEIARSKSNGKAGLAGVSAYLTPYLSTAWIYRNYQPHYHGFYSSAFGENTDTENEKGLYWGLKLLPFPNIEVAGYFDTFSFPWLKFRTDAPSNGYEYFTRVKYSSSEKWTAYFQVKSEQKARNEKYPDVKNDSVAHGLKNQLALDLDYQFGKLGKVKVFFNSRVQWSQYRQSKHPQNNAEGFALIQDLQFKGSRFAFYARAGLFDTDNYDTRQYIYENDVLYAFSIPSYQNRGLRNYLLTKYEITYHLSCWLRMARYHYLDKDKVGSGLETINGNKKTTWKIQLRYKL